MGRLAVWFVHPLDIVESDRFGEPIEGLRPAAAIGAHADAALERLRLWLKAQSKGKVIRTRVGGRRVLPSSVRVLARQYVYDQLDETWFKTMAARQYARRYYTYALEVKIGERLETLALLMHSPDVSTRNWSKRWRRVVIQLQLDTP